MEFEDIAHKYEIRDMGRHALESGIRVCLVKVLPVWPDHEDGVLIGYFKDETIARNVALALEFYKEKNKMIDGVLVNDV